MFCPNFLSFGAACSSILEFFPHSPQNREGFVIEGFRKFLHSLIYLHFYLTPLRHSITNSSILEFFPHPIIVMTHEKKNPVKLAYAQAMDL